MLPSELLAVKIRKGNISPVFAYLTEDNLEVAFNLIRIFEGCVGKKQRELAELAEELEGTNFRFIRGLRTLLERRCIFETKSLVDPIAARRLIFEEANKTLVTTKERRAEVLKKVAATLGISEDDLEKSLFADHESEQVLKEFSAITPEELLKWYNLSLAQTLLFKAVNMEVFISGNYQNVFRKIKYLGLMYLAEKGERMRITIEGPASLFKMTEKYGTAMAKLLPEIISDNWKIKATVVRRGFDRSPRTFTFEMDDSFNNILLKRSYKSDFDSTLEKKFCSSFNSLSTGWTITREPELLMAGNSVFIPDFGFQKRNMKFYMEIVGFWTEDYLKKKLRKLKQVKEKNMIIAVDENLACSGFADLNVIYFKKEIPLKEVYRYLRMYEEKNVDREVGYLEKVEFIGDVISIPHLAREHGISSEAMEKYLSKIEIKDYLVIGEEILSSAKVEKIREKLGTLKKASYQEVASLLQEEGISSVGQVLDFLGYEVRWHSLDPQSAVVIKRK
jgi:hypothetical protein